MRQEKENIKKAKAFDTSPGAVRHIGRKLQWIPLWLFRNSQVQVCVVCEGVSQKDTERWNESWGVTGDVRLNFECISYISIWPQGS